jgi:hypothetical protein
MGQNVMENKYSLIMMELSPVVILTFLLLSIFVALVAYPIKIVVRYSKGKLQAILKLLAMKEAPKKAIFFLHPVSSIVVSPLDGSVTRFVAWGYLSMR